MSRKARPMQEALQGLVGTFKQFEKKLDKLQMDVNYHGKTLNDLRILVSSLSNASAGVTLSKSNNKQSPKKANAKQPTKAQQAHATHEEPMKVKRKNAVRPLPSKLKTKGLLMTPYNSKIISSKRSPPKHPTKKGKAKAPRKVSTNKGGIKNACF